MWHSKYFNWLEEGRINALAKIGINYFALTKNGFELPLIDTSTKYLSLLFLGDNKTIETIFKISKSHKYKYIQNSLTN